MSDFPITIDVIPAAEDCFGRPSEYEESLRNRVSVAIPAEDLGKVWVGTNPPPADKTDWVWARRGADGRPVGLFSFYQGGWRPFYPSFGQAAVFMPFSGAIADIPMAWAIADGLNGTEDMRQFFTPASGTIETSPNPVVQNLKYGLIQYVGYS